MPHIEEKKPSVIREVGQWVLATLFMVAVAMMVPLTAWFIEPNLLVDPKGCAPGLDKALIAATVRRLQWSASPVTTLPFRAISPSASMAASSSAPRSAGSVASVRRRREA